MIKDILYIAVSSSLPFGKHPVVRRLFWSQIIHYKIKIMSKSIWKFPLETTDIQQIEMPAGAEILSIQVQNEQPCIWALVEPSMPKSKVAFEIFGTGHSVPENGIRKYIGTYQLSGGALVFHCFELLGLSD